MNLEDLKKEVLNILKKSPVEEEVRHADCTHKWILALKPDADEAMQIAAFSHDIDRAITGKTEKDITDMSKYKEFKKEHSLRSAQFISEILKKHNYPNDVIKKVANMVLNHEFGGDEDSDTLRDADSIAYFEYNLPIYLKRNGEEKTKNKILFMYNRASKKAKSLIVALKFPDTEIETFFQKNYKRSAVIYKMENLQMNYLKMTRKTRFYSNFNERT